MSVLDEFYTEKQLAVETKKSGRFWKRQRDARTGPPWKYFGKTIIYPKVEFKLWLQSGLIKPARRAPRPRLGGAAK
jgi:hypothetical protein